MARYAGCWLALLVACSGGEGSPVGVWTGTASDCDDAADDGTAVTVSVRNSTEAGDAAVDVVTSLGLTVTDATSCTGDAAMIDAGDSAFAVDYTADCGSESVTYALDVVVEDDAMTGSLSWPAGTCALSLARRP